MFPILQLGPLALQTPGLILLMGIWLSLTFAEKQAKHSAIPSAQLDNLVLVGLLSGIIGARLAFLVEHYSAFISAPLSAFSLTTTMLNMPAGLLIAILAMLIYGQRKKIPMDAALDGLTPFLMGMLFFIALANLASGEGYGAPTNMPWGIDLWGAIRHPSQIYDLISALLILLLILRARTSRDVPGLTFYRFLALASASRLFLEAYRGDSVMLTGSLRSAQVIAWLLLGLALWQLGRRIATQKELTDVSER